MDRCFGPPAAAFGDSSIASVLDVAVVIGGGVPNRASKSSPPDDRGVDSAPAAPGDDVTPGVVVRETSLKRSKLEPVEESGFDSSDGAPGVVAPKEKRSSRSSLSSSSAMVIGGCG